MNQQTSALDKVRKFTSQDTENWMEYSGVQLADVVNEDEVPAAKLGAVGFSRAPEGASSSFEFDYDEVLIITKGRCTIRSGGHVLTAGPGELLYLPAKIAGTFHADTALEMVYVASSPYGVVNRDAKAELLARAES